MPREFYEDTDQTGLRPVDQTCYHHIEGFDGPFICKRPKDHPVTNNSTFDDPDGQFHQEEYEGWIWTDKGEVG
jgi:hypothetical protein